MTAFAMPFNLQQWIEDHRDVLKPPVCNKQIFKQNDYIVMVVGGPNHRTDYHYNETPELFYQIEGEMVLKVIVDNESEREFKDIPIRAGDIFLLPGTVLHSPQREPGSIGMVVEQKRQPGQKDGLHWFCPQCHHPLYHETFMLEDIERDMPVIFDRFYGSASHCTCSECGTVMTPSSMSS
ncbi:3-hydroxyanthranilate 3,4-dioxygenase [Endozoicomonas sp.]|uniref:3-hydroxyanthranilate 3,4-dioxygenase n=1 Tax=Endozoicomonas sp. TaxID=1892382 RepID=UPI002885796D|nr:3-hydroxyanthranilate 3,4-dioxygenase [Endozoicomonas sp.]